MKTRNSNRRFNTGGNFFKDNVGNFLQLGMGAATGNPGLIASGGVGIASSFFTGQEPEPDNSVNDWILNNRHNNINSRHAPYSMFLETGGRMQRVSKMRPEPQGVSKAPGGQLQQEASNAFVARGNTHEQGGIQTPGGEIEDNETIVQSPMTGETQVHSDQLGYADDSNQLADAKGKLEHKLQSVTQHLMALQGEMDNLNKQTEDPRLNKFEKNKIKREFDKVAKIYNDVEFEAMSIQDQIQQIDMEIEQNFQQQEQEATMMGMRDEEGMPVQEGEQPMFQTGGNPLNIFSVHFDRETGEPINPNDSYGNRIPHPTLPGLRDKLADYYTRGERSPAVEPHPTVGGVMTASHGMLDAGRAPYSTPNTPAEYFTHGRSPAAPDSAVVTGEQLGMSTPRTSNRRATQAPVNPLANHEFTGDTLQQMPMRNQWADEARNSEGGKLRELIENHYDIGADDILSQIESELQRTMGSSGKEITSDNSDALIKTLGDNIADKLKDAPGGSSNKKEIYESILPFISNIANTFFNRQLDNINPPKGQMMATPTMDANVNINPQLENIQSQTAAYDEFIRGNVAGGPTARAAHSANRVSNVRATNELRGEQGNIERQIRNQNLDRAAQIASENVRMDHTNQLAQHGHDVASIERRSANIANAESKLQQLKSQNRLEEYQNKQIELAKMLVDGTSIGAELDMILGLFETEDQLKQALAANNVSLTSDKGKSLLDKYKTMQR